MEQNVTAFTHSDFGRTLTSNGDGSDHAWGGIQLVVGGAVRGGQIYGDYPLLQIGSAQDVGGGRFIPTVSADQYAATLASWFGVTEPDTRRCRPEYRQLHRPESGIHGLTSSLAAGTRRHG